MIADSGVVLVNEKRGVCLGVLKSQLKNDKFKSSIPSPRGLFEAIECFV
jgi:hypothetical protein